MTVLMLILQKSTIILSVYCLVVYVGRNILQEIPYPYDGVNGFRVVQVSSGALLLWILINVSHVLINKVKILRIRFATNKNCVA
jgi:hypothetical protein